MLFAALLSSLLAAPPTCESWWNDVWKAFAAREPKYGETPLFRRLPDAQQRLRGAWLLECKSFTPGLRACLAKETLAAEVKALEAELTRAKVPRQEIDRATAQLRAEWTPMECKGLDATIDRAASMVAADAGL